MLAEWSVECSAEDPILVVPWSDPDGTSAFVDLRANPYDFDAVAEAEQYPALMQALRALNAARSPVFTAKCDAWTLHEDELSHLQMNLDVLPVEGAVGFASYIDLVWSERSLFASLPQHEQVLRRLTRLAAPLDRPTAALDCIVRPAFLDIESPQQGYAVSLYVKSLGHDPASALKEWGDALDAVVALIRGREFLPRQGRARPVVQAQPLL
jgi:hypothetical protein